MNTDVAGSCPSAAAIAFELAMRPLFAAWVTSRKSGSAASAWTIGEAAAQLPSTAFSSGVPMPL